MLPLGTEQMWVWAVCYGEGKVSLLGFFWANPALFGPSVLFCCVLSRMSMPTRKWNCQSLVYLLWTPRGNWSRNLWRSTNLRKLPNISGALSSRCVKLSAGQCVVGVETQVQSHSATRRWMFSLFFTPLCPRNVHIWLGIALWAGSI